MISIKKTLDRIEQEELRFQAALACYLAAITSIEQNPVPVDDDLVRDHRSHLKTLRRRIKENQAPGDLEVRREELDLELRQFCEKAAACIHQREWEVKRILELLADAAGALSTHNHAHSARLASFTKELESIAREESLSEIRSRLSAQVTELRFCAAELYRNNEESILQLRNKLKEFQERLQQAEARGSTDALTGVANRREGERKLDEHIGRNQDFSILLLDLDGFKMVNDRWGHQAGDVVLKHFARRLVDCVRPQDTVCRWGGDEFLVILAGCSLQNALRRSKDISARCSGEYAVADSGRFLAISLEASIGLAEYRQGESAAGLFRRADIALYQEKAATRAC